MSKRISFKVEGDVQGVGFRDFTRKHASAYNVTGWVRNTNSGSVEGEAQGDEEQIKKFVKDIQKGPRSSSVTKVDQEAMGVVDGEAAFEVRH